MKYQHGDSYQPISGTTIYGISRGENDSGGIENRVKVYGAVIHNSGTTSAEDFIDYVWSANLHGVYGWDVPHHSNYVNYGFGIGDSYLNFLSKTDVHKDPKAAIGDSPPGAGGTIYHIRADGDVEIFRNLTELYGTTTAWSAHNSSNDYYDVAHDYSMTETAYNIDGDPYTKTISNWERVNMTEMTRIADNILAPNAFTLSYDPTTTPYYWTTERGHCGKGCTNYGVYNTNQMYYPWLDKFSWLQLSSAGVIIMRPASNYFPGPHNRFYYTYTSLSDDIYAPLSIDSTNKVLSSDSTVSWGYGLELSRLHVVPLKTVLINKNIDITCAENDSLPFTFENNPQDNAWSFSTNIDLGTVIHSTVMPDSIDSIPDYSGEEADEASTQSSSAGWNLMHTGPVPSYNVTKITYNDSEGNTGEMVLGTDFDIHDVTDSSGNILYSGIHSDAFFYFPAYYGSMIIAKDTAGDAYLPEWNFNGLSVIDPSQSYQVKSAFEFSLKFDGIPASQSVDMGGGVTTTMFKETIKLQPGWCFIRYPGLYPTDLIDAFSEIVEDVIIVKDNEGRAYLPEWAFNGIGDLQVGGGYQVKMGTRLDEYEITF